MPPDKESNPRRAAAHFLPFTGIPPRDAGGAVLSKDRSLFSFTNRSLPQLNFGLPGWSEEGEVYLHIYNQMK